MRRLFIAVVLAFTVLATADVAEAKGPDQAALDGPGLAAPIELRGRDERDPFWRLSDQARFWSALDAESGRGSTSTPIGLGARYEVVWSMSYDPSGGSMRQLLYPFAAGGPRVYTPGRQDLYGMPATPGWHRAAPTLTATLRELGIVDTTHQSVLARKSVTT